MNKRALNWLIWLLIIIIILILLSIGYVLIFGERKLNPPGLPDEILGKSLNESDVNLSVDTEVPLSGATNFGGSGSGGGSGGGSSGGGSSGGGSFNTSSNSVWGERILEAGNYNESNPPGLLPSYRFDWRKLIDWFKNLFNF